MRKLIVITFTCFFVGSILNGQEAICLDDLYPDLRAKVEKSEFNFSDSNEVKKLWNAWRTVIFHKPDSAYIYAKEALRTSLGLGYNRGLGGSMLRMGNAKQYGGDHEAAEAHIKCAVILEQQFGLPKTQAIALSDLGNILYNRSKLDGALESLEKSLDLCRKHNLTRQEAMASQNLARVYNAKGFHRLAVIRNLASLKIFEDEGSQRMTSGGFNTLGITYLYAKDYKKAIESFSKAINISKNLGNEEKRFLAEAYGNSGFCFMEMHKHDSAYTYYEMAHKLAIESKDIYGIMMFNSGKAAALTKLGQAEDAIRILEMNLHAYDTLNAKYYEAYTKINLAKAHTAVGDLGYADELLQELYDRIPPLKGRPRENFLKARYKLFLAQENTSAALDAFKEMSTLKDSLAEETKISELQELEFIYNLEKKENEIDVLNERREKDQWKMSALALGILASILLGILAFIYQRRRARKKRKRDAEQIAKVEAEKIQLAGTVEAKERELTAQSVVSANQQEELQRLKKSLQELSGKNEVSPQEFNRLIRQVDQQLAQDQGWDQVLQTFKEVQPGFIEGLVHDYPSLTSSDLRLAALLRMNLDSKTIASLVHISPDSVKRARNRFRQKINIDPSIRLQDWITRRNI